MRITQKDLNEAAQVATETLGFKVSIESYNDYYRVYINSVSYRNREISAPYAMTAREAYSMLCGINTISQELIQYRHYRSIDEGIIT